VEVRNFLEEQYLHLGLKLKVLLDLLVPAIPIGNCKIKLKCVALDLILINGFLTKSGSAES